MVRLWDAEEKRELVAMLWLVWYTASTFGEYREAEKRGLSLILFTHRNRRVPSRLLYNQYGGNGCVLSSSSSRFTFETTAGTGWCVQVTPFGWMF